MTFSRNYLIRFCRLNFFFAKNVLFCNSLFHKAYKLWNSQDVRRLWSLAASSKSFQLNCGNSHTALHLVCSNPGGRLGRSLPLKHTKVTSFTIVFHNSEKSIRDIRPYCRLLFRHRSVVKSTYSISLTVVNPQ